MTRTTTSRIWILALVASALAAAPAMGSEIETSLNATLGGDGVRSGPASSSPGTSLNATLGGGHVPEPVVAVREAKSTGFEWGDALIGAGAALALVALGGAALLTVRRRTGMAPTTASMS